VVSFAPKSATILEGRFAWAQYAPCAALAPWISSYWALRTEGPHVVRTLPDACVDIAVHVGPRPHATIAAPEAHARRWESRTAVDLVGARLQPGAAALLGIAVERLPRGWTPLETMRPAREVARLVRDVMRGSGTLQRIAALDAYFAERLLNRALDPRLGKALREAFARQGDVTIAELARRSGAHTRTLARLFEHAVGLSPKKFVRIVRVQAAVRATENGGSWARVAHDFGYCDQAHLIREVREVLGTTPREVMRLASRTL
jgi:AraC-like DNA-binding protein